MGSVGKWAQSYWQAEHSDSVNQQVFQLLETVHVHFVSRLESVTGERQHSVIKLNVSWFLSGCRCVFNNHFQVEQMLHVWLYLANVSVSGCFHMQKCALFWVTKPHEAYVSERQWSETEESSHSFYFPVWCIRAFIKIALTSTNEKKTKKKTTTCLCLIIHLFCFP